MRSIYWFKKDLRIEDNKALREAIYNSKELIPIFIFDKNILREFNSYNEKLGFITESIKELSKKIKIYCFYDRTENVFENLIQVLKPDAIFTAKSFSWRGESRDEKIKDIASKNNIKFFEIFDNYLADFTKIPYTRVFTPFYKKWINNIDNREYSVNLNNIKVPDIKSEDIHLLLKKYKKLNFKNKIWKIEQGIERLNSFNFKNYGLTRNMLDIDGTSKLSPYIRFGTISIRKVFNKVKEQSEDFIKELAWREFWYHIKFNFKEFNNLEFQQKRRNINWENNDKLMNAFFEAKTGYPIIDAGIIQLKTENWLHNRMRMILANFLTKDLFIDWRIGEKFFREHLLDYDEVVNTGNWQWNASVGPDPKPLRIFNPIVQAKKFDPKCNYIKKYLPELKNIDCEKIHDPIKFRINYYKPIINHIEQTIKIKTFYTNSLSHLL